MAGCRRTHALQTPLTIAGTLAEQVKAKARELADQVAETAESSSTRGGPSPDDLALRRAKAREIANMTLR